jgi:hypothetical protein
MKGKKEREGKREGKGRDGRRRRRTKRSDEEEEEEEQVLGSTNRPTDRRKEGRSFVGDADTNAAWPAS